LSQGVLDDLQDARWIYLKGVLFAVLLVGCCALILLETRSWAVAGLLAAVVWSAARLYYFMFYVIQHYVDHEYRFSGVFDFLLYACRGPRPGAARSSALEREAGLADELSVEEHLHHTRAAPEA
jgi:hypothetical protein